MPATPRRGSGQAVRSAAIVGIDAVPVDVEVEELSGLPSVTMVGTQSTLRAVCGGAKVTQEAGKDDSRCLLSFYVRLT